MLYVRNKKKREKGVLLEFHQINQLLRVAFSHDGDAPRAHEVS